MFIGRLLDYNTLYSLHSEIRMQGKNFREAYTIISKCMASVQTPECLIKIFCVVDLANVKHSYL